MRLGIEGMRSSRSRGILRGRRTVRVSAPIIVAVTVLVTGTWARAAQGPEAPHTPKHSVWDGVYTEAQAQRGKELYTAHCLVCHGETLEGSGPVKALSGPEFAANWNGLTLGDMLERTRTSMPMDNPGTLSRQQIADVLAFVLNVNKMPSGSTELPRQSEILSGITFLAQKL